MSYKVKKLVNKKSKFYLGRCLPDNTIVDLSNYDKSFLDVNLTKIEYNLCLDLIYDWIKVYKNTKFRTGRIYALSNRLWLDLGLSHVKDDDGYYKVYLHFF